jgi:hypothetical protein
VPPQYPDTIAIEIGRRQAVNCALAIAEWDSLVLMARTVVELDGAGSLYVPDYDLRFAIVVQIRRKHQVWQRIASGDFETPTEVTFTSIEVYIQAEVFVTGRDLYAAVTTEIRPPLARVDERAGPKGCFRGKFNLPSLK